jgi:hypothetical protein
MYAYVRIPTHVQINTHLVIQLHVRRRHLAPQLPHNTLLNIHVRWYTDTYTSMIVLIVAVCTQRSLWMHLSSFPYVTPSSRHTHQDIAKGSTTSRKSECTLTLTLTITLTLTPTPTLTLTLTLKFTFTRAHHLYAYTTSFLFASADAFPRFCVACKHPCVDSWVCIFVVFMYSCMHAYNVWCTHAHKDTYELEILNVIICIPHYILRADIQDPRTTVRVCIQRFFLFRFNEPTHAWITAQTWNR